MRCQSAEQTASYSRCEKGAFVTAHAHQLIKVVESNRNLGKSGSVGDNHYDPYQTGKFLLFSLQSVGV